MTQIYKYAVSIILIFVFTTSCQRAVFEAAYPTLTDGRYDSEFPYRNCSKELDIVSKTVKKLYCLVEYDGYYFEESDDITSAGLQKSDLKHSNKRRGFVSESVHGTATVISNTDNHIVVLTCAHVVNYPDTVYSYFLNNYGQATEYLESVAIKKKQVNFVRDLPDDGKLEIIAMDEELDIAFLGNYFPDNEQSIPQFEYPTGDALQLEWGSFVYILGYPAGYQMVTRGIVSNPNPTNNGEFLIDALFNTGVSGGVVLAVRDGVPNFELVGIAKSVSAKYTNVLKPANESHQEIYNPNIPYAGDLFVKMEKDINYGVTFTVSIGAIRNFYFEHRTAFTRRGYNLDNFFGESQVYFKGKS